MADLCQNLPSDCTSDYVYEPLESPHSFRLIRIQPDLESSQNIHCTIERYERGSEECPSYTALSYVWGDASERKPVTLNGQRAYVTTNLHQALWNLKSVFPDLYFWIDALSIDQNNVGERGHQVNQMKGIYSDAKEVVAWLGVGNTSIGPLFMYMREHEETCKPKSGRMDRCELPKGVGIRDAIRYLGNNAYWSRVWVIQELVFAAGVRLMCGEHVITWRETVRFFKHGKRHHFKWELEKELEKEYRPVGSPNSSSYIVTFSRWPRTDVSLARALGHSRFTLATDYRDKIYATLGLVNFGAGTKIEADYSRSPCKVICIALQAIAEDEKEDRYHVNHKDRSSLKLLYRWCKYADRSRKRKCHEAGKTGCLESAALRRYLRELLEYPEEPGNTHRKSYVNSHTYCEGVICGSREVMWKCLRLERESISIHY
ncbi:heterokaryon incompatibility protein-domain-containing protein [Paraphoma chrysanthemicola]|uniref:Heterokaryon incompatibility protein-domain-containing protein n=1 Tax=Paraphoma chrysanthemicola TaxID=798071 RepID=A0A8K0RJ18_9PLEO|nr:heterokaryon incompatibility protein-domain-containing protein [Paraphoma chrysanthemicola]